jgi:predicted lipoprotein with Yx(FWY)xxD motif
MKRMLLVLSGLALLGAAPGFALASAPADESAVARARATLTVRPSDFGRILFDGRGYVLYAFTRDPSGRSACAEACAKAWPPYILRSGQALRAGSGTTSSLLRTTRRSDGTRQVTYAGRPLYYYVGDRRPGQVSCQNVREFGGLWLVVRASGSLVRG